MLYKVTKNATICPTTVHIYDAIPYIKVVCFVFYSENSGIMCPPVAFLVIGKHSTWGWEYGDFGLWDMTHGTKDIEFQSFYELKN